MRGSSLAVARRSTRRGSFLVAVVVTGALVGASGASAASFTVIDPTDAALTNPAGTTCVSTDGGKCTLRAAVQAADNSGGSNTITLPAGTYKLTIASTSADDPSNGDLDVKTGVSLTINGGGASSTTINANYVDRAFAVQQTASLAISGVTVEHGVAGDPPNSSTKPENGGAFYNDGSLSINASDLFDNYSWDDGGAIYTDTDATATSITNSVGTGNTADDPGAIAYVNAGTVTMSGDAFTHNAADDDGGVLHDNGGSTVTISGSTFSENAADGDGGAVEVDISGTLSVSNSVFDDDQTSGSSGGNPGGAIYVDGGAGAVTVTGSTFDGDSSGNSDGGAIYDDVASTLSITGSTFNGDGSGDHPGGAVYTDGADLSVSASSFTGDEASEGGALFIEGSSATAAQSVTTSTFTDNQATDHEGGAIDDDKGALTLSRSTFSGNDAAEDGGALNYDSGDGMSVTNDTFDGNQAADGGGAIYLDTTATTGTISLLSDTITRNTSFDGGGIAFPERANSIEDTIVTGNNGGTDHHSGEDCFGDSGSVASDSALTADTGGNIDSDGTCFSASVSHDHVGVNPDLGPLAPNGGPTQTDALLTGSPAIGNAVPGSCPTTDERGVSRPAACDSGAFQTAAASLGVTGSAPGSSPAGRPLAFAFRVTDSGAGAATGVTFTDKLPTGSSYYSSSASQGSCTGTGTVTCSLGAIDSASTSGTGSAGSATVTIVVIPSHAGTFKDTASASASNAPAVSGSASTKVTPAPSLPVAITGVASQLKSSSAKLSGIADPEGASTKYYFQYGTSKRYGKKTKSKTLSAGTSLRSVVASLSGLKAGNTYHFRLVAVNANGTFNGKDAKFTTKKTKPKKKKH
jgi:uncharacterized repeat protein (TIGR01451 family)